MTITLHYLRLQRTALLVWAGFLALWVLAVTGAAPAVTEAGGIVRVMESLPPALRQLAGGEVTRFANPVDAYVTVKLLGVLPAVIGVYVVLAAGAVVAREQAMGTLEFLFSLPVDRGSLLRQRHVGVMVATALLYSVTWLSLVAGLEAVHRPGSYGRYALVLLAGYAVNMAQAALVLILSVILREYAHVVRWGLALVLGAFLFSMVSQIAGVLAPLRTVLLYGLANPFPMLAEGRFPWGALLAGVGGTLLAWGWGGRLLARREFR